MIYNDQFSLEELKLIKKIVRYYILENKTCDLKAEKLDDKLFKLLMNANEVNND